MSPWNTHQPYSLLQAPTFNHDFKALHFSSTPCNPRAQCQSWSPDMTTTQAHVTLLLEVRTRCTWLIRGPRMHSRRRRPEGGFKSSGQSSHCVRQSGQGARPVAVANGWRAAGAADPGQITTLSNSTACPALLSKIIREQGGGAGDGKEGGVG